MTIITPKMAAGFSKLVNRADNVGLYVCDVTFSSCDTGIICRFSTYDMGVEYSRANVSPQTYLWRGTPLGGSWIDMADMSHIPT